jgi:hypothetical protein
MVPGNRHPVSVETGRHSVEPIRSVHVVLDVFLLVLAPLMSKASISNRIDDDAGTLAE